MTEMPEDSASAPEPTEAQPEAANAAVSPSSDLNITNVAAEQPTVVQPSAEQPTAEQPTVPQPAIAEPTAEQPTVPQPTVAGPASDQPTAPQSAIGSTQSPIGQTAPTPDYGQGSFGQPATPVYAPATAEQPYATQPGTPVDGKPTRNRRTGLIVVSLAVAALIGGVVGGGVGVGVFAATQSNNEKAASAPGPTNITVNNPDDATVVTAVAAKASPSVVTISVAGTNESGTGSGIVLTSDGYILTNTHVVTLDGADASVKVQVQDNAGKLYTAKVIGTDPIADLAVIKLDNASGLTPATFANSSKLNVGDTAVAIGAPLGLSGTVTNGIVSALNRSISIASSAAPTTGDGSDGSGGSGGSDGSQSPFNLWNFDLPGQGGGSSQSQQTTANSTISLPVIQTDAAINPGNSGGALLNDKGQVIGINVAIASASDSSDSGGQSGSIGVGFAIPANLAQRVAQELIKDGKASHGMLGASVADASSDSASTTVGAEIKSIVSGDAAAKAGLKVGDIITNFNGIPITSATDLTAQVRYLAAGSTTQLTYVRSGSTATATVTLGSLPQ